jgi:hypothetical protein
MARWVGLIAGFLCWAPFAFAAYNFGRVRQLKEEGKRQEEIKRALNVFEKALADLRIQGDARDASDT